MKHSVWFLVGLMIGTAGISGCEIKKSDSAKKVSDAEIASDLKAYDESERELEGLGLKFEEAYQSGNLVIRWNQNHLKWSETKPEVTSTARVEALKRFVTKTNDLLNKYAKVEHNGELKTLKDSEKLRAKIDVAQRTISIFEPLAQKEKNALKFSELDNDYRQLKDAVARLEKKGVFLSKSSSTDVYNWDETELREFFKDELEKRDARLDDIKYMLQGELDSIRYRASKLADKWGSTGYVMMIENRFVTVDANAYVTLGIKSRVDDANALKATLEGLIYHVGKLHI